MSPYDEQTSPGSGPRRRFLDSLLSRLLGLFGLGAMFVIVILLTGNKALHDAELRIENAVIRQIQPLAATHRLQTRINDLRTLELELTQLRDFFAMDQHLARMRKQIESVAEELTPFIAQLAKGHRDEASRLTDHWQHYRTNLDEIIAQAGAMNLAAAENTSRSHTRIAHAAISTILRDLVRSTEVAAEVAYQQAKHEQERQRDFFLAVSLGGFIILAACLLFFARSMSRRIQRLSAAATGLASGVTQAEIPVMGSDEIANLSAAFNTMQEKVVQREHSLRTIQGELEDRVTARTQALAAANARLWMLSQAVEQSPIGVLIAGIDQRVEYCNPAYTKLTGKPAGARISSELPTLWGEGAAESVGKNLREALTTGRDWEGEACTRRADGRVHWEQVRLLTVRNQRDEPAHLLLMREDITERRKQEEKVAYQAYYDHLTELPNRTLALDRLQQATSHAGRDGSKCAVLFIDLDNFKQINDTLGHIAGDELLQQAAQRLSAAVRKEDTVARLGGDEFLVIMRDLHRASDADVAARKIIAAFSALFKVEGREFGASPSIGVSLYPDDGTEPTVLLRNADLAMYEAKEAGRNTYRFFNQGIHDNSVARLELERQLRGALDRGELTVHYQPLVCGKDHKLVGAEALLRWHHPELGNVSPDVFIPVAEQSGLIVAIGEWVLHQACAQAALWRDQSGGQFIMAVNVSPRQFSAPGLVSTIGECVEKYAVPRGQLEIEVTEGLLIRNATEVRDAMLALDKLGVTVALDDFGTGYSSLSYLRAFPFHTVKIDRSFVRDISADEDDCALVIAAIRMAHALGLRVVAEGVETDAQRRFLSANSSNVLQGYLFGRPTAQAQFTNDWFTAPAANASQIHVAAGAPGVD